MYTQARNTTAILGTPGPSSLLVKPVGARCNLRCSYCCYRPEHRGSDGVMSLQTLRILTAEVLRLPVLKPGICWQGGEPTLAGLAFYKQAVELQKELGHGRLIANSLQTNGLVIDEDWAEFLGRNDFLVGLSLDGPEHMHDANRIDSDGKGSWKKVMDTVDKLRGADVPVNILCSLAEQAVPQADELFGFFEEQGFAHVQFTPLLETRHGTDAPAAFSLTPESYGTFLCRMWDRWVQALGRGKRLGVRFFESFCHRGFGLAPTVCEMYPCCGTYAVVEHDGCVYPCDFFVNEQWKLGTLERGLPELLYAPKSRHFNEIRLMLRTECRDCFWKPWCHGGCLKYRQLGPRLLPKTFFCEAYRRFFMHAWPDLPLVSGFLMQAHTDIFQRGVES
ncbi:MAG: SPASM domain-containing protein [Desulfovibrionaceae bacterium]|nr:SPASM domain-containing protein [Desulfovibrionaceae bacterium]